MNNWSKLLLNYLSKNYPITNKSIITTKEISLDGHFFCNITPEIKSYLEKFINLEILNMSYCKLKSLDNLPKFPNLYKIDLSENFLDENEFIKLKDYPFLSEIYFVNNKVKNFDTIKIMNSSRNLHLIDLSENPINSIKDYRKNFFDSFPRLIFLDGIGKNNELFQDFEDNEENEEEEEENDDDKNFITFSEEYEEEEEEEEEEEDEDNDLNSKNSNNGISNNNINYVGNNFEENEEEEEEIENYKINFGGKRKKYR